MNRRKCALACGALLLAALAPMTIAAQGMDVPKTLVEYAKRELAEIGRDPVIVRSVLDQNARQAGLSSIKQRDEIWQSRAGLDEFMFDLMRNRCSYTLLDFQIRNPFIVEIFAMDNQGALVGMTHKTSDYWQGDEAKFSASFNNGAGALHFGDAEYDASAGEIMVQVSVPVMQGSRAIGAITFGVSLDRWESR